VLATSSGARRRPTSERRPRSARAEAEQRIAQAQQLESDAQERRASLEQEREEIDERLARADQVDPRVGTHAERTAAARAHTETGGMGENGDADAETDASGRRLSTEDTEVVHETSTSSERG